MGIKYNAYEKEGNGETEHEDGEKENENRGMERKKGSSIGVRIKKGEDGKEENELGSLCGTVLHHLIIPWSINRPSQPWNIGRLMEENGTP